MIPLFKVHMPENIGAVLQPVFDSGLITEGPQATKFQNELALWLGTENVSLVNSGTSALTLAVRLSGAKPGTAIISTPQTCLATNEAILALGADIIWADIDPLTGNIDPDSVETILKTSTCKIIAIMCVDWSGNPCKLKELQSLASKYGIKLIEDAAHSFGAQYNKNKVGLDADFVCFSFQAIKHLTTVDGGALVCRSKEDHDRATLLKWFGATRATTRDPIKWEGDVQEYGYKFHMNDITATIGLEQMKSIDSLISKHKNNGKQLASFIDSLDHNKIKRLLVEDISESSYWIFSILLPSADSRESFVKKMKECSVSTGIVHTRNDTYSLFSKYKSILPGMDEFSNRMINIPCGWWVDSHDLYHISKSIEASI